MPHRNGDFPYQSTIDAMRYWPEKETAVAIRKKSLSSHECVSAFGFESLFNLELTFNSKRSLEVFEHRVNSKNWLAQWPLLKISP